MKKKRCCYSYELSNSTTVSGFFNIYQSKGGGIYLTMGNRNIELSKKQVIDLYLDVFALADFDYDLYQNHYKSP